MIIETHDMVEQFETKLKLASFVLSAFTFIALLSVAVFAGINAGNGSAEDASVGGAGLADQGQWFVFDQFTGYQTKADPQKIAPGGNPVGQNTYINNGDRISVRDLGYELFPATATKSVTTSPITSMHTFRKRDGTNIMMGSYSDKLVYKHPDVSQFEVLENGYTSGADFGFADHNTNVDQTSYVYFGNAVEAYSRWTGNVAVLTDNVGVGSTTIQVDDTTLFPATGTITFCETDLAYSAKTATTFTIAASTVDCDSGRGVAQVVETFPAAPKGNKLLVSDTRMFVSGVASSTQTLFYSAIADATDFTFSAPRTAEQGGLINMPEGGGGIVGMALDEGVMYVFKRNLIKSVTFTQDGDDLPIVKPIKPHDGKSQTLGAVSDESIFSGGNGIIFITPNNEIMSLSRVESVDYPQAIPISDIIKPTADAIDWSESVGVYWKNKGYISGKSTSESIANDTILVYDFRLNQWDSPILGLNIGDIAIANFDGEEELYYGDGVTTNFYKFTEIPLDDEYDTTANWRSREETFGAPHLLKTLDSFYVEGYIADNTTISISLLLDEDGYTQTYTTDFEATESNNQYRYISGGYNLFGFHPFGFERFGSNENISGKKKFRIYLSKELKRISFYSAQVEFASSGQNQQWEILQYGFHVVPEPSGYDRDLLRVFQ